MRKLYSATTPCKAGCKYCFSKWDGVYAEQPVLSIEPICEKEAIIYPCCDGEFFDQRNIIDMIKSVMDRMDKVYLSISTKQLLTPERLQTIIELNNLLQYQKKGFVKFSVSLSSKYSTVNIEPGTVGYEERLSIAQRLRDAGIPNSLTLKPILPFIKTDEYFEILNDFSSTTNRILVGGLYVCPETRFYHEYIKGRYQSEKHEVNWLAEKPIWDHIRDEKKITDIKEHAQSLNMLVYESDLDVVKSYIDGM